MASTLCDRIVERAGLADVFLTPAQTQQLADYYELLQRWNHKVNLSSLVLDGFPDATLDKLLVEPLVIKGLIANTDDEWLDLGSGGGSPAIPLKIVCPSRKLVMVESRSKKTAFLREAVRRLQLTRTSVWTGRIEELPGAHGIGTAELVTVRAVKMRDPLLAVVASLLRPGGRLAIFGTTGPPAVASFPLGLIESTKLPNPLLSGPSRTKDSGQNVVHWFARLDSA